MPHPCPHHCPPGRSGAAALVALVVLVVIAAAARPVVHGAELVLEVAAIAVTSAVVLAVLGGVAYVAVRARRSRANRVTPALPTPVASRESQALSAPQRRAIEAPRPGLADLKALAAEHGYDLIRRED